MFENLEWSSIISAAASGICAGASIKTFIPKILREIETNTQKTQEALMALSSMALKQENTDKQIDSILDLLQKHDRKIVKLETKLERNDKRRS